MIRKTGVSDESLAKLQGQIGSDYYYLDCKEGGPNNAGVFFRYNPHAVPAYFPVKPGPPAP